MIFRQNLPVSLLTLAFTVAGWINAEAVAPPGGKLPEIVADAAPAGWKLYDEVLQFTPDNLYEQINGRAELFLSYNVVSLTYATFDDSSDPNLSINLSIYDMGTTLNAFGVFSVERSLGEPQVDLGREAYRSGANHYVWKGRYYIQAIVSDSGKQAQEATWGIVQEVSSQLKDTGEEFWGANVFPPESLVKDSLKYFLVDALGLEFMRNTFTALYQRDGIEISTFISKRASEAEAFAALEEYSAFGKRYGKRIQRSTENGTEFLICEMQRGYDVVTTKGTYLVGVTAVPGRALAYKTAVELHQHCCSKP